MKFKDYFQDHIKCLAEEALTESLQLIDHIFGITISRPVVTSYNPTWRGDFIYADFHFLPFGDTGIVKINSEKKHTYPGLFYGISHELGHTAMYQHNSSYKDLSDKHGRPFFSLDEGLSDHFMIDCSTEAGKRHDDSSYRTLALRRKMRNFLRGRIFFEPYSQGYRHVARLRKSGVEMKEIIEDPVRFLSSS